MRLNRSAPKPPPRPAENAPRAPKAAQQRGHESASARAPDAVRLLDTVMCDKWDAFVDTCPDATFFHRAGWQHVIRDSFGHDTHFFHSERNGEITGVLPLTEIRSLLFGHALISNAFSVSGGPAGMDEAACKALNARALALFQHGNASYLEYRSPARLRSGWTTRDDLYAGFSGPLPADEADNLKQIPRKQRAVVRKAGDAGLTWRIDDDVDTLHELYAISVHNLGTPVFSKRYFQNLVRTFAPNCDILTVSHGGKAVAAVLSFYFRDRVMPFYTGSLPEARKLGANDLMYWQLMRHGAARGARVFDFGRSKVETGPYHFKKNWGFTPRPIAHQFLMKPGVAMPDHNPLNPKYRTKIALWKRLPLAVANRLGPIIVRNIG
jgi:FemAB-related protein (PEP-CTERM system-associated)